MKYQSEQAIGYVNKMVKVAQALTAGQIHPKNEKFSKICITLWKGEKLQWKKNTHSAHLESQFFVRAKMEVSGKIKVF